MPHNPPSFRLQQSALPRTSCVRYVTTESAMSQKHQQIRAAEPTSYPVELNYYVITTLPFIPALCPLSQHCALYPSTEQATSYGGAQSLSSQYYTFVDSGTYFILMRCTITHDRDTIAPAAGDSIAGPADAYVDSSAYYTVARPPESTTAKVAQSNGQQRSYAESDVIRH